ncbi:hypothetical protein DSC45_16855 [Streptomyces sp. YIM 130001]|uniref:TetR/AcrR family transcriptional regulator n=1 Tax=Streptomyces sp. YIM 130001 TaxID=2259644 RepID=UPI000E648F44|nr:TetR/AcrR family transcriptional regulator [Streptomyces sp. YIM 130001]RII15913.1 hypothetical protein DSC45_16855 [Streptomyces sp. YIM 130001]
MGGGTHAETVRLLWGPHARPSRGPRPTLDLDRVTRAGIDLADADGLAEVSMQRVAARLGVTKMALYRYIPGKAELIALMVDSALGECPATGQGRGNWRDQLAGWAAALLTRFHRHPWLLDATTGPRVMGPRELSWMERAISALDGTGLDGSERMDAAVLLVGHARTIAQHGRTAGPAQDPDARLGALLGELMEQHGERFPALTAALASAAESGTQDDAWEFGLRSILDGLTALIAERRT